MQKAVDGQETEVSIVLAASMLTGVDHDDPFQLSASPCQSTAMQKLEVGHETDIKP